MFYEMIFYTELQEQQENSKNIASEKVVSKGHRNYYHPHFKADEVVKEIYPFANQNGSERILNYLLSDKSMINWGQFQVNAAYKNGLFQKQNSAFFTNQNYLKELF